VPKERHLLKGISYTKTPFVPGQGLPIRR